MFGQPFYVCDNKTKGIVRIIIYENTKKKETKLNKFKQQMSLKLTVKINLYVTDGNVIFWTWTAL